MKAIIDNKIIAGNIKKADKFISRLVGLLNRKSISKDEGLLLMNCSSIHCFFMKFTIDVVYLSKDMKVLYKEAVKPWRIGKIVKGCAHVLELAEGAANEVLIGDYIVFEE